MKKAVCIIAIFCLCISCTLLAGCVGGNRFPTRHTLVTKTDSGGTTIWSIPINTGNDEYATAVIETADGGYAVAGTTAQKRGFPNNPRVIRLDRNGKILWDRTLETLNVYSVAIAEAADGGFVVAQNINNYDSGKVAKIDTDGQPVWNRSFDIAFTDVVPVREGNFVLTGTRTILLDANGTTVWDRSIPSTSIIPAADGGFIAERSGVPNPDESVLRFDTNGTVAWTRPLGMHQEGKIASLFENADGTVEAVYTWWNPDKDKEMVWFIDSERVTIGKEGNISDRRPFTAVSPMTRTADGGFAFLAYAFPSSTAFTTLPHADSSVHLVKLSSNGSMVWDQQSNLGQWTALQSILQVRDGGYVTLVVLGS